MGRPLNKKYFANRNVGSLSTTTDKGIGGQGVYSVTVTTAGSYTTLPLPILTAPSEPNGVTATISIISEVLSATVSGSQSGTYVVGDLLTITSAGGTAIAYVATVSTGAVATVNFTGTGASRGSFTSLSSVTTTGGSGSGVILTPTYRAASVAITDEGSGYLSAPTVSNAPLSGSVVLGTVTLTTAPTSSSPAVGTHLSQEPGIKAYAYTGSSSKLADIVKQVSTTRYKVNTSDTSGTPIIAKLKTTGAASSVGEMTISATDSSTNTYWVQKLTAHRVVIVPNVLNGSSFEFPLNPDGTPQRASWTFGTALLNTSVTINNG